MTDLCWSFWKADSILPLGPAQRKPWIRPAIMTAPSPRKVGGLWMYNPGGCGARCLNDCCLIHLRSHICGKVNLQEQLGSYIQRQLCVWKKVSLPHIRKLHLRFLFWWNLQSCHQSICNAFWGELAAKRSRDSNLGQIWATCWFTWRLFKFYSQKFVIEESTNGWWIVWSWNNNPLHDFSLFASPINQPNY